MCIRDSRRDLSVKDMEARFKRKDGLIVWVLLSVSVIQIEGLSCILGVMRDISAAKDAEEKLEKAQEEIRTSEERYRTVFQASLDGISITQLDNGRYIDVNERFLQIIGFEREEIIGNTSLELGFWQNPANRKSVVEALHLGLPLQDREARFKRKNGEFIWILLSISVIEIRCV